MKILTLNLNTYKEKDVAKQLAVLAETIASNNYDVIALQEITQSINAPEVSISDLDDYIPCQDRIAIKKDNTAYQLSSSLNASGQEWFWTFLPTHIGWDNYDEGLAFLTRHPIRKTNSFFVSDSKNYNYYKTRMALGIQLTFQGRREWFYNVHFDKWNDHDEPFSKEWDKFLQKATNTPEPLYVMGAFNNDSGVRGEGYDYILETSTLFDSFSQAEYHDNGITIDDGVSGFNYDEKKDMRIDFVFTNTDEPILSSHVVFNDKNLPKISGHFGIEVNFGTKKSVFKNEPSRKIPEFSSESRRATPPAIILTTGALTIDNPLFRTKITGENKFLRNILETFQDMMDLIGED